MERHQPSPESISVAAGSTTALYIAKSAPRDVPVTFLNTGPGEAKIYFHVKGVGIPLPSGRSLTANPDNQVYATSEIGSEIIVATGVSMSQVGESSTGSVLSPEAKALALALGQKELLAELLLQARLGNRYLESLNDERFDLTDLD